MFPEAEGSSDEQVLKIAREMNLSETVFVLKPPAPPTESINDASREANDTGRSGVAVAFEALCFPQKSLALRVPFQEFSLNSDGL